MAIFGGDTSPPTVLSVTYNDGDAQRSMLTSIALAFSEQIATSLTVDDLQLVNTTTGQVINAADLQMSWDNGSHVATWLFPNFEGGSLGDGDYVITVASQDITDEAGNHLDGNGDGAGSGNASDDWQDTVWRFFGDVNADRSVSNADLFVFRQAFGTAFPNPNYNAYFDADADAQVANTDLFPFRQNFGASLDTPPAASQNLVSAPLQQTGNEPATQPLISEDESSNTGSDTQNDVVPVVTDNTTNNTTTSTPTSTSSAPSTSGTPSIPTPTDPTIQQLQPSLASLAVEQRSTVDSAVQDADVLLATFAPRPNQLQANRSSSPRHTFKPWSLDHTTGITLFDLQTRQNLRLPVAERATAKGFMQGLWTSLGGSSS